MGEVYLVKVFNMMRHGFRQPDPPQPVPEGFNYEMWCGPAPVIPYNPSRRWLDQWEFSCGAIAGDAVHQIDLARFLIGDPPYPDTACNAGSVLVLKDGRDIPDTQMVTYEYGPLIFLLQASLWMPYMKKTPSSIRESDQFPNWPFSSTKVELYGTEGFMYFGRHGGGWQAYDAEGELVHSEYGRPGDREHQEDFLSCVRSRNRAKVDVEFGHQSALLCHLANISYRVGNKQLEFDGRTETVTNISQANQFLKREYRKPWVIPEVV
jgi:predicted dehydrogenase